MKKRTLIALGLAVSMMASTATAFAGEGGYVINENGQRVWVDDLSTYQPTQPTEGGHYEVNENGQQEWVEGNTTSTETTNPVEESKPETNGNGSTCGTYTKSTVKEYMVSHGNDGTMVTVKEDPEVTGSHNGRTYIIVYQDGAKEYIRNGKSSHIVEPAKTTNPTTPSTNNSGNTETGNSGVVIRDGINVKSCPTQSEIKAYVKAHPFTDNKVNWDKVSYKVKPNPENGVVGELSDRSIEQYKNYLNFARFCCGLPEITINKGACKKAQCAAALTYLALKNGHYEAHNPVTRPLGLTDEQWELGKEGCAKSNLTGGGNINYIKSPVASCQGFLQDQSNKIGHRVGELGNIKQMGIGFVNGAAADMYLFDNNTSSIVNSEYFTYPSKNFPVELMQANGGQISEYSDGMWNFPWSVHLGDNYSISNKDNLKVVFTHSRYGTKTMTYSGSASSMNSVSYSKGAVYFTPMYDEDGDNLSAGIEYKSFDIGDKCTVTLTGIEKNGQPATIKYTTTLFSVFGYDPIYSNKDDDSNVEDPTEPTKPSISKPNPAPSVTVKKDATGDKVTTGSGTTSKTYSLTSVSKKYAKLVKTGSATTLTVPDTIKSKKTGKSYKVTAITARVKKNAKLTSLTIGNNVTTIGTAAFYGNKSLKKIVVKGNLTSVGSKAFKGVPKTAKVYVYSTSKTKYNAVVKKLKAAGLTKNSFTYKAK